MLLEEDGAPSLQLRGRYRDQTPPAELLIARFRSKAELERLAGRIATRAGLRIENVRRQSS